MKAFVVLIRMAFYKCVVKAVALKCVSTMKINCVPQIDNNASGPLTLSDCRLIDIVFILTALDEGDIALLKTYVSISLMNRVVTESHVCNR